MILYDRWSGGHQFVYPGHVGPGNEWYVSSVIDAAYADVSDGKSWIGSVGKIDEAVNLASNGDTVWVAPDHAETITGGTDIELDTAGVAIIGCVRGRDMPEVTIDNADSTIAISGVGCTFQNIRLVGTVDALVSGITASAADCAIINTEIRAVSTDNILAGITTTASADRLLIDGFRFLGTDTAGDVSAIVLVGADDLIIRNFEIYGDFSDAAINFKTTPSLRVQVYDGYIWTQATEDIAIEDEITGSTGRIGPNINIMLKENAANITEACTAITFHYFNPVQVCNLAGERNLHIKTVANTGTGYLGQSTDA